MLLSMRATVRGAFWPNEATWKNQPAAAGNDRRVRFPVSGLFFTGNAATPTCRAVSARSAALVGAVSIDERDGGQGPPNPRCANFAMAHLSPRGDNVWTARSGARPRSCNQGRSMCIRRRRVISARVPAFGAMLALLASTATAPAQNFPSRPLTLPFAAGGPSDVAGRILAQGLSEVLSRWWWR